MRVLITGITGFAGSHLAEYVLANHPDVAVYGTVNDLRWVTSREFLDYDFPPADEKTMSKLLGLVRN